MESLHSLFAKLVGLRDPHNTAIRSFGCEDKPNHCFDSDASFSATRG
jgi:hypothetical protein